MKINIKNDIYDSKCNFSKRFGVSLNTILLSEMNGTVEFEISNAVSEFVDTLDNTLYVWLVEDVYQEIGDTIQCDYFTGIANLIEYLETFDTVVEKGYVDMKRYSLKEHLREVVYYKLFNNIMPYKDDVIKVIAMVGLTKIGVEEIDSEDLLEIISNTIWETKEEDLTVNKIMEYAQNYYKRFMEV